MIAREDKLPWLDAVCCVVAQARHPRVQALVQPTYRAANPLSGLCYTLSEAVYHLSEDPLEPWWVRFGPEKWATHWFLKLKEDGRVIDVTGSQFGDSDAYAMYGYARRRAFLTKEPSKRAKAVLALIDREDYWLKNLQSYSFDCAEARFASVNSSGRRGTRTHTGGEPLIA